MISSKKSVELVQTCSIAGVPFHNIQSYQWHEYVKRWLSSDNLTVVFTPNPEIMLKAIHDKKYERTLSSADISLPDGQGLRQMSNFLLRTADTTSWVVICFQFCMSYLRTLLAPSHINDPIPKVITGSDTFFTIHNNIPHKNKVFYFGGEGDVPKKIVNVMKKKYPKLEVAGCGGYPYRSKKDLQNILDKIAREQPQILFVALPFPLQERFVMENKAYLESIGIRMVMVVGGTFDFAVEKIKRAPEWMKSARMEWLWRLFQQPSRIGRIFDAVFVFPYVILQRKLRGCRDLLLSKS